MCSYVGESFHFITTYHTNLLELFRMKTVRSESSYTPSPFPQIKQIIQNTVKHTREDDQSEHNQCPCQQPKPTNRKVATIASNLLQESCCCNRLKQPIILERNTKGSHFKKPKHSQIVEDVPPPPVFLSPKHTKTVRSIEKFEPVSIPTSDKKHNFESRVTATSIQPKQIEIHLQNSDKACMKKLFKRINKLTEDLHDADKLNATLKVEIAHLNTTNKRMGELEKENGKLKEQVGKLMMELSVATVKTIQKIIERPIEIVKHVPVEKIVEVEVVKYIPGPERVVEKVVEKRGPHQAAKEDIKDYTKQTQMPPFTPRTPDPPPTYWASTYPLEVPIEVPVYIDSPTYYGSPDSKGFFTSRETQASNLHRENQYLGQENQELYRTIQVLKRHNHDKNKELETLVYKDFLSQQIPLEPSNQPKYSTHTFRI